MADVPISLHLRPNRPDFLELPWNQPVELWPQFTQHTVTMPQGVSRHPVVFVMQDGKIYAIKELPPSLAEQEFDLLRKMEELQLPSVTPVGYAHTSTRAGEYSVLITRYLDYSLPYSELFSREHLASYRDHLLDAMAGLLVQLHLHGVYWGDCSLGNTLFRRDAGRLQAYLVDAETSSVYEGLSEGRRSEDLDILEENIAGGLADLIAAGNLDPVYPVTEIGHSVRERYQRLWDEVAREIRFRPSERYRIQERIQTLNSLGFSISDLELISTDGTDEVRLRLFVSDRQYHRNQLKNLTGLEAEEMQAQQMVNEIHQLRADLQQQHNFSVPLSVAAYQWLITIYTPVMNKLTAGRATTEDPAELYCQLLEHKWYLSERAKKDVGHLAALEDWMKRVSTS